MLVYTKRRIAHPLLGVILQAIFLINCAVALYSRPLQISAERLPSGESSLISINDFLGSTLR